MTNLPAQLSTLQTEISALTEQLAPAGADDIGRAIASLMDGGMMFPQSIKAANPIEEYRSVLKGVPMCGLRAAFVKLKRGEYDEINPSFIPLPAALAKLARDEAKPKMELRRVSNDRLKGIQASAALLAENTVKSQQMKASAAEIIARVTAETRVEQ